jgi:hypothetical protein
MWPFQRKKREERAPVLFLHIQKTAGTSLVESLRPRYADSMISHGDFIGHAPEEFRDRLLVSGHFGHAWCRSLMPSRTCFTFLRDPVERVLSFYHFCRAQTSDEFSTYARARELDLDAFLAAVADDALIRKNLWNNQAWQLAHGYILRRGYAVPDDVEAADMSPADILSLALEHLDDFHHVGLAESFAADQAMILAALGIDAPAGDASSFRNATPGRPRRAQLPAGTLELITALTELDQSLYDEVLRRRGSPD